MISSWGFRAGRICLESAAVSGDVSAADVLAANGAFTADLSADRVLLAVSTVAAAYQELAVGDRWVMSNTADTIVLPASPATGQVHTVKDISGTASFNNITILPSGGTIDGLGGFTLANNWSAVSFLYNGSEWSAF